MRNRRRGYTSSILLAIVIAAILWGRLQPYMEEYSHRDTEYIFTIRSEHELTKDNVTELGKLRGLVTIYPVTIYPVTLQVKNYTLQVELRGVDISEYPLVCKADGTMGIHVGNQPILLISDSLWDEFTDSYGHKALTDQLGKWREQYQELTITMAGEEEQIQGDAKVGAIVAAKEPVAYIDNTQLEQWLSSYGVHAPVYEACIKLRGLHSVKNATKLLSDAGLTVGEWSEWKE